MKKLFAGAERFKLKTSYLGLVGIVNNERQFNGLFSYGKSTGALWTGVTHYPLRAHLNNFQVLSTDYENYAIVYECMEKSILFNRDIIHVLVRDPDLSKLESGTEERVLEEFGRLFGEGAGVEKEGVVEEGERVKEGEVKEGEVQEGKNVTENGGLKDKGKEETFEDKRAKIGKGIDFGRKKPEEVGFVPKA